jgi:hypothetical protein
VLSMLSDGPTTCRTLLVDEALGVLRGFNAPVCDIGNSGRE